jgi:DnaJ-class molecular chaperone
MFNRLPDWHEEYRKIQGFIFNDDGLFDVPDNQVEACNECGGSGLISRIIRDPDDRTEIRKHVICHDCAGYGFVENAT